MRIFFKYMGGKSREIPRMNSMFPRNISRVVEPFAGSAAVSFHLEKPSFVSDINFDVINLLKVVKDSELFPKLYELAIKHRELGPNDKEYYLQRDILNDRNENDPLKKAWSYLYVRQLCFSGMNRITKTGNFNVPFGWGYKNFNTGLSLNHHLLLQSWDIELCSFEKPLTNLIPGDFVFIDPPYYERLSDYSGGHTMGVDEELHIKLFQLLNATKEKWLVVHVDCDLYRDLYRDYNIKDLSFQYSMNFMGRTSSTRDVKHLYITNYEYEEAKSLF